MINDKKVCGIIAEYNPFHNGHKYQLDLIRKSYDFVVVVMSGSFTQRGDVAIIDKWSRAKSALLSGADLVLELPTVFAMSPAERFAFGGVSLLNSLGCVDALSFGSEIGSLKALEDAAKALADETEEQSAKMQEFLKSGMSYAAARECVFKGVIPEELLSEPNNILAVEYIKKLIQTNSKIIPITHKRTGSAYKSDTLNSEFSSASAIRANKDRAEIKNQMPEKAYEIFKNASKHSLNNLDVAALFFIRQNGPELLKNTFECSEGLENRIYEASKKHNSIEALAEVCSSKRHTKAKIRRIILSSMLKIEPHLPKETPRYARVLGATQMGRNIIANAKETCGLQFVTKTADYKEADKMFETDILATDIWALASSQNYFAGQDFYHSPIML